MNHGNNDIDFVVTWVDGNDPNWQNEKSLYLKKENDAAWSDWVAGGMRYRDWGLLRYWFRGVETCAPWVRKIHFVTWGHIPAWLDVSNPKLNIVRHGILFQKSIDPLSIRILSNSGCTGYLGYLISLFISMMTCIS